MNELQQGSIVKVSLNPTKGHEQAGYRPVLILQNTKITQSIRSVVIVAPISNTKSKLPFQVKLDDRTQTTGSVLCRQIRSIDLYNRPFTFVEQAPEDILLQCIEMVKLLIEI